LSPEVVVLGGGIAQADDALFEPLRNFMADYEMRPAGKATPVVKARFNEYSGAIGAACFALSRNGGVPMS
jgi:glucokinase